MAFSFKNSANQIQNEQFAAVKASVPINEAIPAYSNEITETFQISEKYLQYKKYADLNYSFIDEKKNISVNDSQINITQESNSQYIPFEMDRYWDGIDLMEMSLQIHFVNKSQDEDFAVPVNVTYSDTKIRFAWLVDNRVTAVAGDVQFEIWAIGVNEKGNEYRWVTKPGAKINIMASLSGNGIIRPSQDWITQLVTQINEKIALAQTLAQEAKDASDRAVQASDDVQNVVDSAKAELQASLTTQISAALSNHYTKEEVDKIVGQIDFSTIIDEINAKIDSIDGLAKFNPEYDPETRELAFKNGDILIKKFTLNSNPTEAWVTEYNTSVDSKISVAVKTIDDSLNTYKEATDADLQKIHSDIDGLPETLAADYYTKEATNTLLSQKADKDKVSTLETNISAVSSLANTNKTNIGSLGTKVGDLEAIIGEIDTSPGLKYEATYDENQIYTLWEIEGEGDSEVRTPKGQFKIQGGSGSGGTSSVLKIEYITKTPVTAAVNDTVLLNYSFSGTDSSGDAVTEGTATWRIGSTIISTGMIVAGENSFDVTKYLSIGTQKVMLTVTDDAGSLVTKTWTVQKIDVRLESTFNDRLTYPIGTISFDYTPYGALSKTVHFVLDGKELPSVTTTASGIPMAYTLPQQIHGSHLVDAYMTAEINGTMIESNHIVKDVIWYDAASNLPVISCVQQKITAKQYDTTNIVYSVYDPTTETPTVTLAVDGITVSTLHLDSNTQTWQYKTSDIGNHILTITCGKTVKTLNAAIEKLDINLEPVTAGLVFDFNPTGKSNNDADRLWTYGNIAMDVSDNFNWVNGGYQIDENGDQYFAVKAGSSATINYQLFADDAKRNGKEFKLIFKTAAVRKADATFLSCDDGSIGLQMNVHEAYVKASAGNLYLPYSEEDIIEFEFNINKNTDGIPMIMGYEDGVATRPLVYSDSHDFTQISPKLITIGSPDCDVMIYRMKVYNTALTDRGILNNFIADARNAEEMISRYNRNQIYDENNQLTPEVLAEKCPNLRIYKLEAPHFTNNKKDTVYNTTIQQIYKNGDAVLDNWTAYNAAHSGQGTTSNEYGAAGRNLDYKMNCDTTVDGHPYKSYILLGDGVTRTDKISLSRDSVGVNYLNLKVNIASSENANNALLQKRYNTYNPYIRPIRKSNPKVKDSMEFFNAVIFVKESDPDLSTHREFNDCEWHFYAMGNIGDSKKTDNTRVDDPDDVKECILEIMDNTLQNSAFPSDTEALENLEKDPFDESMTYGWRYLSKKATDDDVSACNEAWRTFYKFVVQSSDEEFKSNLKDYFVVDSALYFYLFTLRYTMIDNRAKNTFWHYGKCDDGKYRWDLCFDYDNDTGLGINNSGELTMTYGYEDTDYKTKGDASTGYAFNAAASTFFCRIRDLFADELRTMFVDRESAGAWSAEGLISQFDNWQDEFPEELWRLDIERKYLRSYREGSPRFLTQMANGKKKYQRRQFERNQEKYMATKFFGNVAVADQIMFRCNTPTEENLVIKPDYTLHLTPYSDMYLSVMFGATYRQQVRAEAGKEYSIACPFETMDDTAVLIYCASQIQAIGDISACYIHDNDFSKASKLQELIIGSEKEGYKNSFLTNLGIGNNVLLKKLDIQNAPNLTQALNLSGCSNLEELYAFGSGLTGVTFANGGKLKIAKLPGVGSLTMRNLPYLTNLDISAYENITTLVAESCNTVDVVEILSKSPNISRIRITGIDWIADSTALLDKLYTMNGIDKNGYNVPQSVLAGRVHVPVMREKILSLYNNAWPDLEITYDTLVAQFTVTFVNSDGTVLDIQYVDKGEKAVDPITRKNSPIPAPTMASSVSTDYAYSGWDTSFVPVFANQTITALYNESPRKYTVKYVSKGVVLQETIAEYGTSVFYTNEDIPIYTAEESAYKYYLFNGWDKSGYVNGNKTINAMYDTCEYTSGYFNGKDLSALRPVEIYALTKVGKEADFADYKDTISFTMGNDYTFDDIEENEIISSKTVFNGSNYIDTGILLLEEDKDFVIAIDYEFATDNTNNSVLVQCYRSDGSDGFRLWNNNQPRITWGTSSGYAASIGKRDIIVLRHIKGETQLHVYKGDLPQTVINYSKLTASRKTELSSPLVFGCSRADDGAYENYAKGTIYWCKVWYTDLGDTACRNLAAWTHETVTFEMCGFKKYYLSDNSGKRTSMTFLASQLLSNTMPLTNSTANTGGWANTSLNAFLNGRFYNSIPVQWRQLLKQAKVSSTIGDKSTELSTSNCYVFLPSALEVDASYSYDGYSYETTYTIPYVVNNAARIRKFESGIANTYWLRSPNLSYSTYYMSVSEEGEISGYQYGLYESGICPMINI